MYQINKKWIFLFSVILYCPTSDCILIPIWSSSVENAESRCNGSLKIFDIRLDSDKMLLESVFPLSAGGPEIWNGYYIQTPYVQNTGCFKVQDGLAQFHSLEVRGLTITRCWTFCKFYENIEALIIGDIKCFCAWRNVTKEAVDAKLCSSKCKNRQEEFCGHGNNIFNIYKPRKVTTSSNSGFNLCLQNNGENPVKAPCNLQNSTKTIQCRELNSSKIRVIKKAGNWLFSMQTCMGLEQYYLVPVDTYNFQQINGTFWWNERQYSDNTLDHNYLQKHPKNLSVVISIGSSGFKDETVVNWITNPKRNMSFICSTDVSTGNNQHVSGENYGGKIGGVVGGIIALLVGAGIIGVIYIYRKRTKLGEEDARYKSTKQPPVKHEKSGGLTNMSYSSTATLDIFNRKPDRDTSSDYTTIDEEQMHHNEGHRKHSLENMKHNDRNLKDHTRENSVIDSTTFHHTLATKSESVEISSSGYDLASPLFREKTSSRYHTISLDPYELARSVNQTNASELNKDNNMEIDTEYSHLDHGMDKNKDSKRDSTYAHAQPEGVDDETYTHTAQSNKCGGNVIQNEEDESVYTHAAPSLKSD